MSCYVFRTNVLILYSYATMFELEGNRIEFDRYLEAAEYLRITFNLEIEISKQE